MSLAFAQAALNRDMADLRDAVARSPSVADDLDALLYLGPAEFPGELAAAPDSVVELIQRLSRTMLVQIAIKELLADESGGAGGRR